MALFGEDEGDVAPFDMAEDGEDWFHFSLDNLEMDRGCSPLRQEANPMEQEAIDFGDTDQDDDVDEAPQAGVSGPGPPDRAVGGGSVSGSGHVPRPGSRGSRAGVTGAREVSMGKGPNHHQQQQHQTAARDVSIPPAKSGLEKIKPEAKEVQGAEDQNKLAAETAAAKRNSRAGRSEAKSRHRAAGGMAGGVGGMPGRAETASMSSRKDRLEGRPGVSKATSTSTAGDGGGGGGGGGGGSGALRVNSVQNRRRLERNAREQKRSLKISQRIEDLRRMLTQFGVDVKASKSAVLSEATDYIAHLQRQQAQFESERARLLMLLQNAKVESAARATSVSTSNGGSGGGSEAVDAAAALVTVASTSQTTVESPTPPDAQERAIPFDSLAGVGAGATASSSGGGSGGGRPMVQTAGTVDGFGGCGTQRAQKSWTMEEPTGTTAQQSLSARHQQHSSLAVTGPGLPGQGSAAGLMAASGGVAAGLIPTTAVPVAAASVPLGTLLPPPASASTVVTSGGGTTGVLEATARALSFVNYEKIFRMVPLPMAIANVNGNLVDCNARLTQVTGFRREEALFLSIFDLVADPFLQHTFSMISSILSLRGVANPPFFQVVGKRRDGSSVGMVRISVVQDDALRPLHFCVCVMESTAAAGAGGLGVAAGGTPGVAASAASNGGFVTTTRVVRDGRDSGGAGIGGGLGIAAGTGVSGAGGGSGGGSGGSGGRVGGGGAL